MRTIFFSFTLFGLLLNAVLGFDAEVFSSTRQANAAKHAFNAGNIDLNPSIFAADPDRPAPHKGQRISEKNRQADMFGGYCFGELLCAAPSSLACGKLCPAAGGYKMPFADLEYSLVPLLI